MNQRTHADVMTLSHEDDNETFPYWFGRIIGIFHTDILNIGAASTSIEPQRMEFLWVRWFGRDTGYRSGFKAKRLPRVGFLPNNGIGAFGFLDPHEVIRAVQMIPAFAYGRTATLLEPSIARQPNENNEDWRFYYVNM
jgi:hypothetical protein